MRFITTNFKKKETETFSPSKADVSHLIKELAQPEIPVVSFHMPKIAVDSEICYNKVKGKETGFLLNVNSKCIYQPAVSGIPAPSGLT